MTNPTVAEATGASIHYHTEVFTRPKNAILGSAATVAITALALGLIAYFQLLPGMPPAAMFTLLGVGGGVALATVIALTVFLVQHFKKVLGFNGIMKKHDEEHTQWYKDQFQALDVTLNAPKRVSLDTNKLDGVWYQIFLIKTVDQKPEIHLFERGVGSTNFLKYLVQKEGFLASESIVT